MTGRSGGSPQPAAFARHNRGAKRRSGEKVALAIASLQRQGICVSLPRLAAETKRLDGNQCGVAQSTILRNQACYNAYLAARPPQVKKRRAKLPPDLAGMSREELAAALLECRKKEKKADLTVHELSLEIANLHAAMAAMSSAGSDRQTTAAPSGGPEKSGQAPAPPA